MKVLNYRSKKYILNYTLNIIAQLLLTTIRSSLEGKMQYYNQMQMEIFRLTHTKHHFIHHIPSKLLSQNCKQINRVRKKIHGKTSSLLSYMKVPDYLDIFTFSISGARNTSMSIRF